VCTEEAYKSATQRAPGCLNMLSGWYLCVAQTIHLEYLFGFAFLFFLNTLKCRVWSWRHGSSGRALA
jgi:hypothetical protein